MAAEDESKVASKYSSFRQKLADNNVNIPGSAAQWGVFIGAHEVIGLSWLVVSWGVCYKVGRRVPVPAAVPESQFYKRVHGWMERLPKGARPEPAALAIGFASSQVVRKVALPVTIPAKLWLASKVAERF